MSLHDFLWSYSYNRKKINNFQVLEVGFELITGVHEGTFVVNKMFCHLIEVILLWQCTLLVMVQLYPKHIYIHTYILLIKLCFGMLLLWWMHHQFFFWRFQFPRAVLGSHKNQEKDTKILTYFFLPYIHSFPLY